MTTRITRSQVLSLLHEDVQLFERLCEARLLPNHADSYEPNHAETARVAGTLVHDLEVNWSGVEVVLRLRSELVDTRRQVHELLSLLSELKNRE
jgi:hypothetical protein